MIANIRARWGEQIKKRRLDAGLSQMEVAARAGIDKSWLSKIERGETGARGIGDEVRMGIAAALGCRVEDAFPYPDTAEETEPCRNAASATGAGPFRTRATTAGTRSPARSAGRAVSGRAGSRASE
ncbi:helix-turn-helix transcriptional regulator [Actinomadura sp. RB99]|uniref:helix-turn-helix domain-containing protein n=1 Tax=Actinomadura sp. RB99 TaxID=2691577 RepID=UPI0016865719